MRIMPASPNRLRNLILYPLPIRITDRNEPVKNSQILVGSR